MKNRSNITLIGMPGAGKSTIGKALSQRLSYSFLDIDDLIEDEHQININSFINDTSDVAFLNLEEETILNLRPLSHTIIATGGSVVYSQKVIQCLKEISILIYLKDDCERIKDRITDLDQRGIVGFPGLSFEDLFQQREPLYEEAADVTFILPHTFHKQKITDKLLDYIKTHIWKAT